MNEPHAAALPPVTVQSYDQIALEYYDPVLHPTCADFRDATCLLLDRFLAQSAPRERALELGAGKSLVAEWYAAHDRSLDTLTLTDASAAMLAHSLMWREQGAHLAVSAAEDLSDSQGCFDLVFACLGDPYNTPQLWQNIRRWLTPHGCYFYTTPSFEWATRFRRQHQSGIHTLAEFLVNGDRVYVPSLVAPQATQVTLIESSGLTVDRIEQVTPRDMPNGVRSPKLAFSDVSADVPIVTGYWGALQELHD